MSPTSLMYRRELDLSKPERSRKTWIYTAGKGRVCGLSAVQRRHASDVQIAGVAWIWTLLGSHPLFWVLALQLTAAAVAVIVAACARIREINGGEEDDLSQY